MGVMGGGIVLCGAVTGLVLADVPMVLIAGVAFGLMGFLGVFARLHAWWISRVPVAGMVRAAVTRPPWTTGELAALDDDIALRRLVKGMPENWVEEKFR